MALSQLLALSKVVSQETSSQRISAATQRTMEQTRHTYRQTSSLPPESGSASFPEQFRHHHENIEWV
jgi:hypothetical protein